MLEDDITEEPRLNGLAFFSSYQETRRVERNGVLWLIIENEWNNKTWQVPFTQYWEYPRLIIRRHVFHRQHPSPSKKNHWNWYTKSEWSRSQKLPPLLPLLGYVDVCYLDATEALPNKLKRLHNLTIRVIIWLQNFDHISKFRFE